MFYDDDLGTENIFFPVCLISEYTSFTINVYLYSIHLGIWNVTAVFQFHFKINKRYLNIQQTHTMAFSNMNTTVIYISGAVSMARFTCDPTSPRSSHESTPRVKQPRPTG